MDAFVEAWRVGARLTDGIVRPREKPLQQMAQRTGGFLEVASPLRADAAVLKMRDIVAAAEKMWKRAAERWNFGVKVERLKAAWRQQESGAV